MTIASPVETRCPPELRCAIRTAIGQRDNWTNTAAMVGEAVRRNLPSPDLLSAIERTGHPDHYVCTVLHTEPDGSFSVCALVWRPGQATVIHDHVAWCVAAVLQGTEQEEIFALRDNDTGLEQIGSAYNQLGEVSAFAPPGDIHRVRNCSDETAISLHVYGADIARLGSSVRRTYDLPVLTPVS
jgi:predicted metal-dependent enzyme (double-stranded beta helix superfamily)